MAHRILSMITFALLVALPLTAEHHEGTDGALTDQDRAELVELLELSRSELEELAARADGDLWSAKPAEDRWSVGEVVEHILLAEEGLFAMATGALAQPEDPEWKTVRGAPTSADLLANLTDRTQKFQAPEQFVPKGEISREEALRRFAAARTLTIDFVRRTEAPLERHTAVGPAGKMNVHQWMVLCGGHNLRHNLQIVEVLGQLHESVEAAAGR